MPVAIRQELRLLVRLHAKRLSLFATAFVPAWAILLGRYALSADASPLVLLLALPVAAVVAAVAVAVVRHLRRAALAETGLVYINVKERSDIAGSVAIYTLAYVPVVLFEGFTPADLFALLVVMLVIYAMYSRFNLFHLNPVVSMLYRTYRVVDDHGNAVVILSRLKVRAGSSLPCREVSENLYVAAGGGR